MSFVPTGDSAFNRLYDRFPPQNTPRYVAGIRRDVNALSGEKLELFTEIVEYMYNVRPASYINSEGPATHCCISAPYSRPYFFYAGVGMVVAF